MNDVEVKIAHLEEREKSNTKRLDEHDSKIQKLEDTYALIKNVNYRIGNVESNIEKINTKLDEKSDEKGKKWDNFINYVFYFVLCALLTYISTKLGLK